MERVPVRGLVRVRLTDVRTGNTRTFQTSNIACNGQLSAISQWVAGTAINLGYNAVLPPSQIEYGDGSGTPTVTDTGCFSLISGSLTNLSYAQANTPNIGATTLVFQTPAGEITTQITEAFLRDTSNNPWAHTMFSAAFTPSGSETITTEWQLTYAAS